MALPLALRVRALECLIETDPAAKTQAVAALAAAAAAGACTLDTAAVLHADDDLVPGRPARPELVPPRLVGAIDVRPGRSEEHEPPIGAGFAQAFRQRYTEQSLKRCGCVD